MTDIHVRATQPGHYKRLRKAGETFNVPEKLFSKTWMEKVDPKKSRDSEKKEPAEKSKGGEEKKDTSEKSKGGE